MPVITLSLPSEEDRRHALYMQRAADRQEFARAHRLQVLRAQKPGIDAALEIYGTYDHTALPNVYFREGFIQRHEPRPRRDLQETQDGTSPTPAEALRADRLTRPPATRLIARRSNALSLYLSAVYLAHLENPSRAAVRNVRANAKRKDGNPPWSAVAGQRFGSTSRAVRTRVTRALDQLRDAGLVMFGTSRHGTAEYEGFQLLMDDGRELPYLVPSPTDRSALAIPSTFFLNGWHLVLQPSEIVVLFAIANATRHKKAPDDSAIPVVTLGPYDRWAWHGISDEAYLSHNELAEFGLIDMIDTMPSRHRGRLRPPARADASLESTPIESLQFTYNPTTFDTNAWATVTHILETVPVPPRLAPDT